MRRYTQLTHVQRYQIDALKKTGVSQTQIAMVIGVHKSTISRELRRNTGGRGYRPKQADLLAHHRASKRHAARIVTSPGVNQQHPFGVHSSSLTIHQAGR